MRWFTFCGIYWHLVGVTSSNCSMGVLEQLQEVIFLISSWRARHAHVRWHVHTSHICHHEPRCRTRMVHGWGRNLFIIWPRECRGHMCMAGRHHVCIGDDHWWPFDSPWAHSHTSLVSDVSSELSHFVASTVRYGRLPPLMAPWVHGSNNRR